MSNHNQNGKSVVVRIVPTTLSTAITCTTTTISPQDQRQQHHQHHHDEHSEPSETSPLNQATRDNHSDASSSAVSTVTSEQSTKKLIEHDGDERSWPIIRNFLANLLIFLCVLIPAFTVKYLLKPHERGFFCNDESIKYPLQKSTIKLWMVVVFGVVMPIVTILIVELFRSKLNLNGGSPLRIGRWNIPVLVQNYIKFIGLFLFGSACCHLSKEVAKYTIGCLRPYFFHLCRPLMIDGTDCSNPRNADRYIEKFTCSNPQMTEEMLREVRMSFPSAHSNFSFYSMLFCCFYLQSRFKWKRFHVPKLTLQFFFFMIALFTSLSRIADYKHHWNDVVAGAILGTFFAVIINFTFKRIEEEEQSMEPSLPITKCSSIESQTQLSGSTKS